MKKITIQTIQDYIKILHDRGYSASQIKQKIAHVDTFLHWAHGRGYINKSVFKQVSEFIASYKNGDVVTTPLANTHEIASERIKATSKNLSRVKKMNLKLNRFIHGILTHVPFIAKDYQKAENSSSDPFENNKTTAAFLGFILILLFMAVLGAGLYGRFFKNTVTPYAAYPSNFVTPGTRFLSFQGRLTDSLGNPITAATNVKFQLYTTSSGSTAANIYTTGSCSITPDQDGIFNSLIGSDCGSGITNDVFTNNPDVYLGVIVGTDAEMTPRQHIATVGYAINAETLQGLPPGTAASNIAYIDLNGTLAAAPSNTAAASGTQYTLKSTATLTGAISSAQTSLYAEYAVPNIGLSGGASNTLTNYFGDYVGLGVSLGTVTNYYANYVAAPTGAGTVTNKYAFVSEAGAGKVGIGTTAPTEALVLAGASDNISFSNATGPHQIITGGSTNLAFIPGGNVGIGTTVPANKLEVSGSADITGNLGLGTTAPVNKLDVIGAASIGFNGNTAAPTNGLIVKGNVGIGNTSSTGYALDVTGTIRGTTLESSGPIKVGVTTAAAGAQICLDSSNFLSACSSSSALTGAGVTNYLARWSSATNLSTGISYDNGTFVGIGYTAEVSGALVVNGNVGVGTTNVLNKLDVNGGVAIGTYAGANTAPSNGLIISGNAGIGSTGFTGAKLDVAGTLRVGTTNSAVTGGSICLDSSNILAACNSSGTLTGTGAVNYLARWTSSTNLSTGISYDNGTFVGIGYTAASGASLVVNGNVGIGTTAPLAALAIQDGALLISGTGGGTPTSGTGTRLMWVPAKEAFRGGFVSGTQWDNANLGSDSFAFGQDVKATQTYSVAFGLNASSTGYAGFAAGEGVTAGGSYSAAFGYKNNASGTNSSAFGENNIASNTDSFAIGTGNNVSGAQAFASGNSNIVSGEASGVFGDSSTVNGIWSYSFGSTNTITKDLSVALGRNLNVQGDYSFVAGQYLTSTAPHAIVLGLGTIGSYLTNNVTNSMMIGFNSNVPTVFIGPASGVGTYGNVGIGTTAPLNKLEVSGSADITGNLGVGTTAITNKITIAGNASIGVGYTGIAAPTNGLIVQGNVGIGNTSSTGYALDVTGTIRGTTLESSGPVKVGVTTASAGAQICLDSSNFLSACSASSSLTGAGVTNYLARWSSATNLSTGISYDNGTFVGIGYTAAGSGATLVTSGNVGIGISSPSATLEVAPNLTWTRTGVSYLVKLDPTLSGTNTTQPQTAFYGLYNVPTISIGGTTPQLSNYYGDYIGINSGNGSTITNSYGIYVASPGGITAPSINNLYAFVTEANAGNVGIGNTAPTAKLQISNGSILADGTGGTTPISGAGTRLMWIPSLAAFRAGTVSGTEWNASNIGSGSVAFGENNQATNTDAFAAGIGNTVSGIYSAAFGSQNVVSNHYSFSMGANNNVSGQYSFAGGQGVKATGTNSFAFGEAGTIANNEAAFSVGIGNTASGLASVALVNSAFATGDYAIAFGDSVTASGLYSATIGRFLTASNTDGMVLGMGVNSSQRLTNGSTNSLAIGFNSTIPTLFVGSASGVGTLGKVGIGYTAAANRLDVAGSVAIGYTGIAAPTNGLIVTGNVGIGNTGSTGYALDVTGTIRGTTLESSGPVKVGVTTASAGAQICLDSSNFLSACSASSSLTGAGVTNYLARWSSATNLSTGISYDNGTFVGIGYTAASGAILVTNGNVGIGTSSPTANLEIGSTTPVGTTATSYAFRLVPTLNGTLSTTFPQTAFYSLYNVATIGVTSAAGTAPHLRNFFADYIGATINSGQTVTNSYGIYIAAPTVNGTLTNKYALVTEGTAGNVGIGTTVPTAKLSILGNGTTTGFNILAEDSNGTDKFVLLDNGNVGIGYTAPANKLDIAGAMAIGYTGVAAPTSGAIIAGNVGIGTTNPGAKLEVYGQSPKIIVNDTFTAGNTTNLLFSMANGNQFNTSNIAWTNPSATGAIRFGSYYTNTAEINFVINNNSIVDVTSGGLVGIGSTKPTNKLDVVGSASIGFNGSTAAPSNGLIVQGNVGIGNTSSTGYALDVSGAVRGTTIESSGPIKVGVTTAAAGAQICLDSSNFLSACSSSALTGAGVTNYLARWSSATNLSTGISYDNGTFVGIGYTAAASGTLLVNGNVGIKTTNPQYGLDVAASGARVIDNFNVQNSSNVPLFTVTNGGVGYINNSFGVGTTSPEQSLTTSGSLKLVANGTNKGIFADDQVTGGNHIFNITRQGNGTSFTTYGYIGFAANQTGGTSTAYNLYIQNGNVGVGTTAITNKLTTAGNASIGVGYTGIAAPSNGLIVQGNVGIGSSGFTGATLDVSGTVRVGTTNASVSGNTLCLDTSNIISACTVGGGSLTGTGATNYLARWTSASNLSTGISYDNGTFVGIGYTAAASGTLLVNGNVGIGTTNPVNKLDVLGAVSIGFNGRTAAASNGLLVNGNVGIGSSVFSAGKVNVFSTNNEDGVHISAVTEPELLLFKGATWNSVFAVVATAGDYSTQTIANATLLGSPNNNLQLAANGTAIMTLNNTSVGIGYTNINSAGALEVNGKVGIGTTIPTNQLDVNGSVAIGSLPGNSLPQSNSLYVSGNVGVGMTNPRAKIEVNGNILADKYCDTSDGPNCNYFLDPANSNSIAVAGNVGIGTTNFGSQLQLVGTVTSGTASQFTANSITSGTLLSLASTSQNITSGGLLDLEFLPTSSSTAFTGDLLSINVGPSAVGGNLLNLKNNGSSLFAVSQSQVLSNIPAQFAASGDVAIAYDLNFTNQTSSYIKSNAPLYIEAGEAFESNDLTLRTFNSGGVVLDAAGGVVLAQAQNWSLGIGTTSTTALNIQSGLMNFDTTNSRIGIGLTTPASVLHIYSAAPNLMLTDSVSGATATITNISTILGSTPAMFLGFPLSEGTGRAVVFRMNATNIMTILGNGNVGIGNTNPSHSLVVNGTGGTSGKGIMLGTNDEALWGVNTTGTAARLLMLGADNNTYITGVGTTVSGIRFRTSSDSGAGDRMVIDQGGNVGIGNVSPNAQFVVGAGTTQNITAFTTGQVNIGSTAGGINYTLNLGIGTSSPTIKIGTGNTYAHVIFADNFSTAPTRLDTVSWSNGEFKIGSNGNADGAKGRIYIKSNNVLYQFQSSTNTIADYSEYMKVENTGEAEAGDIMVMAPSGSGNVTDGTIPYDTKIVGAVTTAERGTSYNDLDRNVFDDNSHKDDPSWANVGMVGQVYVKVNLENGPITAGDAITTSTKRGIGMRATQQGRILGYAVQSWDGTQTRDSRAPKITLPAGVGYVLTYVHPTYYVPESSHPELFAFDPQNVMSSLVYDLKIVNFKLKDVMGNTLTATSAFAESAIGNLRAGSIQAKDFVSENMKGITASIDTVITKNFIATNKIQSPVVETGDITATGTATLNNISTNTIKPSDKDLTIDLSHPTPAPQGGGPLAQIIVKGLDGKTVATIDDSGNATFSGTLASNKVVANDATVSGTLAAATVQSNSLNSQEASISGKLIAREIQSDTINDIQKQLADIRNQPLTNPQYYQNLPSNITTISTSTNPSSLDSLTVTGTSNLYNLSVSGSATIGSIFVENNSILSLSWDLKLASLSTVTFFDDAVVIAKDGTLTSKGSIVAEGGVKTNEIKPLQDGQDIKVVLQDNANASESAKFNVADSHGNVNASIDASGSAQFKSIALEKYLDATSSAALLTSSQNFNKNGLYIPAIETNGESAGVGQIPANQTEVVIYDQNLTKDSLVYLTQTTNSTTSLNVTSKVTCENSSSLTCKPYFKVTRGSVSSSSLPFNWLIVQ